MLVCMLPCDGMVFLSGYLPTSYIDSTMNLTRIKRLLLMSWQLALDVSQGLLYRPTQGALAYFTLCQKTFLCTCV